MSPQKRQSPAARPGRTPVAADAAAHLGLFRALRLLTSHRRNGASLLKAFQRLRFVVHGLSRRRIFFYGFLTFFPSLAVPLLVAVTGARTGPRDVSFDPPRDSGFPPGKQTPFLLPQPELGAESCLSAPRGRRRALPALETLATQPVTVTL